MRCTEGDDNVRTAAKSFESIGKSFHMPNGPAASPSGVTAGTGKASGQQSLLLAKDMKPPVLSKQDGWREWKIDVEDYLEVQMPGIKTTLDKVRKQKDPVEQKHLEPKMWDMRQEMHRFLRHYTADTLKLVVENSPEYNGWEAWRKLEEQCEPSVGVREAHVMEAFTGMARMSCKNAKETRRTLADFEQRRARVLEVTGEPIGVRYAQSVMWSVIDIETKKHTSQYLKNGISTEADLSELVAKLLEFCNLVDNSVAKEELNPVRIAEPEPEEDKENDASWGEEEAWPQIDAEQLALLRRQVQCHLCKGWGHLQSECPNKKKGGKDAGKGAGKADAGKGKGHWRSTQRWSTEGHKSIC